MNNILEYKGYYTKIEYSVEDHVFYGKIEEIKDLVNFESVSLNTVEEEFHKAVDDYLALYESLGESPGKPIKDSCIRNWPISYTVTLFLRVRDIQSDELGLFLYAQTQQRKKEEKLEKTLHRHGWHVMQVL